MPDELNLEQAPDPSDVNASVAPAPLAGSPTMTADQTELMMKHIEAVNKNTEAINAHIKNIEAAKEQEIIKSSERKLSKMMRNDSDFRKLVTDPDNARTIPDAVTIDLVNQFDADTAKGIITDLISDKNFHTNMENSFMKGNEAYNRWLNKLYQRSEPKEEKKNVPELTDDGAGKDNNDFSNIENYINGLVY
jgi:hypothetical protein